MKPTRATGVIYKKELIDTLRDRRTLTMMVLVPMVVYPLTLLLASEALIEPAKDQDSQVSVTALAGVPARVRAALDRDRSVTLKEHDAAPRSDRAEERALATALIKGGEVDVVLAAASTAAEALDALGTAQVRLYFDGTAAHAGQKRERVETILLDLARHVSSERLEHAGVPESSIRPIELHSRSIATRGREGNQLLGLMLPTLVLTFIAISCFYPAVDLTAGEKERKTLATLLSAPVHTSDVVLGKYLAVLTVGSLAGLLNVSVLLLTLLRLLAGSTAAGTPSFDLSPLTVLGLLGSIVAVAAPVAALMLGAASLARSFRDASTLLTPVLLLCLLPLGATMSPDARLTPGWGAVPLAGPALFMRALLHGEARLPDLLRVLFTSAATTGLLLFLVTRVFADERALFATEGRRADLRGLLAEAPPLGLSTALAFSGVVFVLHYYGGLLALFMPATLAVPITQLLAEVVPLLLLAAWLRGRISPRRFLGLDWPTARAWPAAVVLGASAWLGLSLPGGWMMDRLLPGQAEAMRLFAKTLDLGSTSLPIAILAFAIVPAIAEELTFRGALLSLLSARLSPAAAVLTQALVFGALHGSLFRLLPTALLGVLLGLVQKKSGSVLPGMLIHAATNALLISLDQLGGEAVAQQFGAPTPWVFMGLLGVAAGLFMFGPVAAEPRAE